MTGKSGSSTKPWVDPDDAPEWDDATFQKAELKKGEAVLRQATGTLARGRPKLASPKKQVTLRLDAEVVEKLQAGGPGWQSRANAILLKAVRS